MPDRFLNNKKVLFIGYYYYDYHVHIQKALRQAGAELDFYALMNRNLWYLISRQVSYKWFSSYNELQASNILKSVSGKKYDYVFVTLGFQLPVWFYQKLKIQNSDAIFINYTWDSVRETEHRNTIMDILPYFDKCYSFDRSDCEGYGIQSYLPLFFIDDYANLIVKKENPLYDILFIGSLCTEIRYYAIRKLDKFCTKNRLNFFYYLRASLRFYFSRILRGKITRKIHFKSIKHSDILKYYATTNVVIDLAGHTQSGLTMRTFEVLGAGKKLITTNSNIKHEDFFDQEYISIIDIQNPTIDVDFVKKKIIKKIDMTRYSIHAWLKNLFST